MCLQLHIPIVFLPPTFFENTGLISLLLNSLVPWSYSQLGISAGVFRALWLVVLPLQWRNDKRDGVPNHQHHACLPNRLFRRRSKKTSKFASLAFVRGIHRLPVISPHKGSVPRQMLTQISIVGGSTQISFRDISFPRMQITHLILWFSVC